MLCRDDMAMQINSANANIRKVNAALLIARRQPPPSFPVEAPLAIKDHFSEKAYLLASEDMSKKKADTISWKKDAPDSQAQMLAHYYYVRSSSCTVNVYGGVCN